MTTYLGKRCSFCLPRVPFVNCRQFMYLVISLFGFEGRIWDLIVSVTVLIIAYLFTLLSGNTGILFYALSLLSCNNILKVSGKNFLT